MILVIECLDGALLLYCAFEKLIGFPQRFVLQYVLVHESSDSAELHHELKAHLGECLLHVLQLKVLPSQLLLPLHVQLLQFFMLSL